MRVIVVLAAAAALMHTTPAIACDWGSDETVAFIQPEDGATDAATNTAIVYGVDTNSCDQGRGVDPQDARVDVVVDGVRWPGEVRGFLTRQRCQARNIWTPREPYPAGARVVVTLLGDSDVGPAGNGDVIEFDVGDQLAAEPERPSLTQKGAFGFKPCNSFCIARQFWVDIASDATIFLVDFDGDLRDVEGGWVVTDVPAGERLGSLVQDEIGFPQEFGVTQPLRIAAVSEAGELVFSETIDVVMPPDSDGDGIDDETDRCPDEWAVTTEEEPKDGCPGGVDVSDEQAKTCAGADNPLGCASSPDIAALAALLALCPLRRRRLAAVFPAYVPLRCAPPI